MEEVGYALILPLTWIVWVVNQFALGIDNTVSSILEMKALATDKKSPAIGNRLPVRFDPFPPVSAPPEECL